MSLERESLNGRGTVLIVDDEERVLRLLRRWLTGSGRDVVTCASFEEARKYLAQNTPSVMVVDIRLKGHNGLQFVIWAKECRPNVSCVVLTGFDDPVLRAEAERLGARYLLKPVECGDFLASISTH